MMEMSPDLQAGGRRVVRIEGWDRCRAALADPSLLAGLPPEAVPFGGSNNLLMMDGEPHRVLRRLVTSYFANRPLEKLRDRLEALARDRMGRILDTYGADLIADVAVPLVLDGIFELTGIADEHRDRLGQYARDMIGLLEVDSPAPDRRRAMNAALRAGLIFERDAAHGRATGLHAVLEQAARDGLIPAKAATSTPVVILHGGYENPLNQLGCVIAWAAANPREFRTAAESAPDLLFEEILRLCSPVRKVLRRTAPGTAIDGSIPEVGDLLWIDLESANRDEAQFPGLGAIELTPARRNLGFGHGQHMCPGTSLARLQGAVLIRALTILSEEALVALSVTWREGEVARGPASIGWR